MSFDRRVFLTACTRAGIASPLLPGILYTLAAQAQEMVPTRARDEFERERRGQAAGAGKNHRRSAGPGRELAGGGRSRPSKKMMLDGLNHQRDAYAQIRALKIANNVPPAYVFHPGPAGRSLVQKTAPSRMR